MAKFQTAICKSILIKCNTHRCTLGDIKGTVLVGILFNDLGDILRVSTILAGHCYAGDNAVLQGQDGHFRHNKVFFVRCQLILILLDSSGQDLLAGLLGSNAELFLNLTVTQTDFQAAFRHGLVLAAFFVLILDLAVLVAEVDECLTQLGIIIGGNLYGKVLALALFDDGILQALNGHSGVDTTRNGIVLVRRAQLYIIPHHSCGQLLVTGIFGGNAERIIFPATGQVNVVQAVFRHAMIHTVVVLILDLAVLVTKGQRTGTGAVLMGKGHGKLCRVFCFDLTLQTVDGHADLLGKAAIFLAILGFIAHQIVRIRTRQVQFFLILSRGGCRQLTAIAGVSAGNGCIVIESLFNRDLLVSVQIDILAIAAEFCILQDNTAALQMDTLNAIFKCSTNNCYNTTYAIESRIILRYHFRILLNGHRSASFIIDCPTIDTFVVSSVNNHRSRTVCYCKAILAFRSNFIQRHLTQTVPKRCLFNCSIASTIDNGTSSRCIRVYTPCCHKTTVAHVRSDVIVIIIIIDCYATCRSHINQIGNFLALIMVTFKSISNISDDIDCYACSSDFDREVIISSHLIGFIRFINGVHTTVVVIWNQCSLTRINFLLRKCRHCPRRQECQHHTECQ